MTANIKKRVVILSIMFGLILLGAGENVYAEQQYQDYTYEKDEYVTITGYTGNDEVIVIPSEIDGLPVREIGDYAFRECASLVEVTIPEGVSRIGGNAFGGCENLEKLYIPKTALSFERFSLDINDGIVSAGPVGSGCNIEFGWDETIPIRAFESCSSIQTVIIPDGIKYISILAFRECESLKEIELPETVQAIGTLAFSECDSLKELTVPKSVEYIGSFAFTNELMLYGYEDSAIEEYAEWYGKKYTSLGKKNDGKDEMDEPGCYEYALKAVEATERYLDYFYVEQYPEFGTTLEFGTTEEKRVITELGKEITKDCKTEEEKIRACYEWVRDNLEYDGSAYIYSIDILKRGTAGCTGYAALLRDLLRVNGITAVMVDGFYGDMVNVISPSCLGRENWNENNIEGHAWVEVRYNGEWYAIDSLWEQYLYNTEETAEIAYLEGVEGLVKAYYEGMPDAVANGVVFKDNRFWLYDHGMRTDGNSSFVLNTTALGTATAYSGNGGICYEDGTVVKGLENGELIRDGWFGTIEYGNIAYYRPYGVTLEGVIIEHGGKLLCLSESSSVLLLTGKESDYTLLSGTLALEVGESIDLLSMLPCKEMEGHDFWFEAYPGDEVSIEENGKKVTGKKQGTVELTFYFGDKETGSYTRMGSVCLQVVESVKKINLETYELTLNVGDVDHLSWELEGSDPVLGYYIKNKWVELSSSNEAVASVSRTGRIEAVTEGQTDIIVRSQDKPEVQAVCKVIVVKGGTGDVGSGSTGNDNAGNGDTGEAETEPPYFGWHVSKGKNYWYEDGRKQGTYDDPQGVLGDGTVRGREIYDPVSDGWYWLDAVYDGAKAINKEVWMPYIYQNEATWPEEEIRFNAEASGDMAEQVIREINNRTGKWVRYDENGKMYKGWYTVEGAQAEIYPDQVGNTYYYDHRTGLMAKGEVEIDGVVYYFDPVTGVLQ